MPLIQLLVLHLSMKTYVPEKEVKNNMWETRGKIHWK